MYIMILNLVHKLKCETNLTHIHVISHLPFSMAMFRRPFLRACPKYLLSTLCKLSQYLLVMAASMPSALTK